jgi:uncharacterized protein (TIGR02145 family)
MFQRHRKVHFCLLFLFIFTTLGFCHLGFSINPKDYCRYSTNSFIENKGQIIDQNNKPNPEVLYLLNTSGLNVQLRKNGFSYDVYSINFKPNPTSLVSTGSNPLISKYPSDSLIPEYHFHRIDIVLEGLNHDYTIETSDPSTDYLNYYTTGTPIKGITGVRHYQTITYKNIYPNIDLEFMISKSNGCKYNFIIRPGGRLDDIKLKIAGPNQIQFTEDTLKFKTSLGIVDEVIPESTIIKNDTQTTVKTHFKEICTGVYGFSTDFDIPENSTLIIDPTSIRLWGTYYGGSGGDQATTIAVDHNGNAFLSGYTTSSNNIATGGAFQEIHALLNDCFIVKFNADGIRQWSTYYGYEQNDMVYGSVTDAKGDLYVAGSTASFTGMATPGAHQDTLGTINSFDGFLAKFSSGGQRIWSTYYGGTGTDHLYTVASDKNGNTIVAGNTESPTNIATPGSYQENYYFPGDGYIAKFDSTGIILWGTYYGRNAIIYSCSIDSLDNIFCCGQTFSSDSIATPGAYQTVYGGGYDAFLIAFTPGGQRLWGTYYGGALEDIGNGCTVDESNNIFITGNTKSPTGIASTGSYQTILNGPTDGFLAKFTNSGQRLWGTYFGGSSFDYSNSCSAGYTGDCFITGRTYSSDGIATPNAYMSAPGGGADAFLVKFDSIGQRQWGTYFGGGLDDISYVSSYVVDDTIYFAGSTFSSTNIASSNGHQQIYGGSGDAFLEKFLECWPIDTAGPITGSVSVCVNTIGVNYSIPALAHAVNYVWTLPPGTTIISGAGTTSITVNFGISAVSGNIWVKGLNKCGDPGDSAFLYVTVHPRPVPLITGSATTCAGPGKVYSTASGMSNYQWSISAGGLITYQGTSIDDSAIVTWTAAGNQTISVNYTDANGCEGLAPTVYNVTVDPSPAVGVTISAPSNIVCAGTQVTFTAVPSNEGSAPFYQWKVNGLNVGTSSTSYSYTPLNGDIVTCVLTSSITGCILNNPATSNAITMTVNPHLPVTVSITPSQNPYCAGTTVIYTATPNNQGSTPFYQWKVNGVNAGTNNPVYSYIPVNGDVVTCILNSSVPCPVGNPATSNAVTMVENTNVTVSVSIAPSQNSVCSGTTVSFLATPLNQGTAPFYQWKVNGVNAGTNSTTFSYIPLNGDFVTCKLTSNAPCAAGNPATSNTVTMIVNPNQPVSISITSTSITVCAGTIVAFNALPLNQGTTPFYQWKVNGINAGTNSTTYSYVPLNGDQVSCVLTSNATCATGNPATSNVITMTVNPNLAVSISIAASANPVCSGISVTYTATPNNGGGSPVYQWKVNGVNAGTNSTNFTYNPVAGDQVLCILNSSIACPIGNPATSNTITMNVGAIPVVTFTTCFDTITTLNAKPFKLKGGIPLNGTYSGPGVSANTFNPAAAGVGTKTITYSYTNVALCSASKTKTITVQAVPAFICGNNFIDIRDTKSYPTVQIGGQCWFATDLNYGTMISSSSHQRDNCINEKYCYNDLATNCGDQTYYQWDEIMRYDDTPAQQGLCPPGWHVPTEAEWNTLFSFYINNGFAGSPLKYSGYSGFNALLSGVNHFNRQWDFNNFATFFWSSTAYGSLKAWAHGMNDYNPSVSFYPSSRVNAFSVRCCKD